MRKVHSLGIMFPQQNKLERISYNISKFLNISLWEIWILFVHVRNNTNNLQRPVNDSPIKHSVYWILKFVNNLTLHVLMIVFWIPTICD
jgi:hypothetical protein